LDDGTAPEIKNRMLLNAISKPNQLKNAGKELSHYSLR